MILFNNFRIKYCLNINATLEGNKYVIMLVNSTKNKDMCREFLPYSKETKIGEIGDDFWPKITENSQGNFCKNC